MAAPDRSREDAGPAAGPPRAGFFAPPLPRLIAHRGASGTHPENTLAAFHAAAAAGAEMIELDLQLSKDGVPVVLHDATLDRTTAATGAAAERDASELALLDAGWRFTPDRGRSFPFRGEGIGIPSLERALAELPEIRFTLEVKTHDPGLDPALEGVLARTDANDRILLASLEGEVVRRLRRSFPGLPTNVARDEVLEFVRRGSVPAEAHAFQVPPRHGVRRLVTRQFVSAAHEAGLEVHIWTVNARREMRRLLDLGVDGILTDLPQVLGAVYRERGAR